MDATQPAAESHQSIFIQVAVEGAPSHLEGGVLTYGLRQGEVIPNIGQLIRVPLQNRLVLGFVIHVGDDDPGFPVRPINSLVEPELILNTIQFTISAWMARETASSFFACAALFLPPGKIWKSVEVYTLNPDAEIDIASLTDAQKQVIDELQLQEEVALETLRQRTGKRLTTVLPDLVQMGAVLRWQRAENRVPRARMVKLIRLLNPEIALHPNAHRQQEVLDALVQLHKWRRDNEDVIISLADLQAVTDAPASVLAALERKGVIEIDEVAERQALQPRQGASPALSNAQSEVWRHLEEVLRKGDTTPQLLFGVTGSGKTEIYLRAVGWCLRHQKTAVILVPEIALATQVVRRFVDRFPGRVDVMHSAMSAGVRYDLWRRVAAGEVDVIVGPRSALFAPMPNLGLIVIDEEHDASFKQDSDPRYHARAVAIRLAELTGATLLMGSATPSVETMWNARNGNFHLLSLPHRVSPNIAPGEQLELPEVKIVDLRAELRAGNADLLSRELTEQIKRSLGNHEQSIVLLNRRGMSTVVICRDQGHRVECPNCDIPMVYHADMRMMVCHRCDYRMPPPQRCPECGSQLDYLGAGTQKVEDAIRRQFRTARVMRWDADAVRQHGYEMLLRQAEEHHADIIVGTQMVSKGFDLPDVSTIGVVQADSLLYLPDFRSAERTFQLLTQVAGRAGRRGPGSVVVMQTYTPNHYAVQAASKHDYDRFYEEELIFRQRFRYPPYSRLARFVFRADSEQAAAIEAGLMARELSSHAYRQNIEMELLGPSPAFVARIRTQYQWQIVIRTIEMERLLDELPRRPGWVIDIDPESML